MDDKKIGDIVSMIDRSISQNGGHMNVIADDNRAINTKGTFPKTVIQMSPLDRTAGDLVCGVSTLFEGLDAVDDSGSDVDE